jgi:hypothetical protein
MTLLLITCVSAIAIAVLSWTYSGGPMPKKFPDPKIEIKWGEGS